MDPTVTDAAAASLRSGELTDDAFLGGALHILQPRSGYRAGLDAVMLAAAVPVKAGKSVRVLDAGAGVGTAGLCLAWRNPDAQLTLLEKAPALARIAVKNAERNGLSDRVRMAEGDISIEAAALDDQGLAAESFDHVMANPPFHAAERGTAAPHPLKATAHAMPEEGLEQWARFSARMAAPSGTVTIIHKAEALGRLLAALEGRFGALKVLPLHPRQTAPASRIIMQGIKGSRAPLCLLPGLVLHGPGGAFTAQAEAILRIGAALPLAASV